MTLTLYYREDHHLARLMLDDVQRARLDRLWDELHYISQDSLTLVDALAQLIEYATQDADPKVFEPLRKPYNDRAAAFRHSLVDNEPQQINVLVEFAALAYRRPLAQVEEQELRGLYQRLRDQELPRRPYFRARRNGRRTASGSQWPFAWPASFQSSSVGERESRNR